MAFSEDQAWYAKQAAKTTTLPFNNQSSELIAANAVAKANQAAAERMAKSLDLAGPAVTVHTIDGVQTVVPRGPLGDARGIGTQVSDDELAAMDLDPEVFPACEFPRCKGEGRYRIQSATGRPLSINRDGQLVSGERRPVVHQRMSRHDRARARAGLQGVIGPGAGMAPAQLAEKTVVNVCLVHQNLPHAPIKSSLRFITGPYAGMVSASRRADDVRMRTGYEASVFVKKVNGKDSFYVRGDDAQAGYSGTVEEI
jgi:hypothetical protein